MAVLAGQGRVAVLAGQGRVAVLAGHPTYKPFAHIYEISCYREGDSFRNSAIGPFT